MSSHLLIMLLYLSLAACFCEGRHSLQTSLSHSKDVAQYPSSSTKAALEKVYQATETTRKSRSKKNHKMEDNIRKARRQNCIQRSKTVDASRHMPPCRISEEYSETMDLACCYHDDFPETKQIEVRFQKEVRSLLVGTKWNEAQIDPSKNIGRSSFTDMDYPSAHLAPSVNNR